MSNDTMRLSLQIPDDEQQRNAAAMSLIEFISQGFQSNTGDAFRMAELFFTVTENIKGMYPQVAAQVRQQYIQCIKEEKKNGKK